MTSYCTKWMTDYGCHHSKNTSSGCCFMRPISWRTLGDVWLASKVNGAGCLQKKITTAAKSWSCKDCGENTWSVFQQAAQPNCKKISPYRTRHATNFSWPNYINLAMYQEWLTTNEDWTARHFTDKNKEGFLHYRQPWQILSIAVTAQPFVGGSN